MFPPPRTGLDPEPEAGGSTPPAAKMNQLVGQGAQGLRGESSRSLSDSPGNWWDGATAGKNVIDVGGAVPGALPAKTSLPLGFQTSCKIQEAALPLGPPDTPFAA